MKKVTYEVWKRMDDGDHMQWDSFDTYKAAKAAMKDCYGPDPEGPLRLGKGDDFFLVRVERRKVR